MVVNGGVKAGQRAGAKHMQLHSHAADHADAFAEINLRLTRRMGKRHEDLARPRMVRLKGAPHHPALEKRRPCAPLTRPLQPHVILHHRIAAEKAVLDPQPFSRSKIRFAVCLCLGGAVLSASRIESMTGTSGPSFGFSGSLLRT
jgi:hypothetical protein